MNPLGAQGEMAMKRIFVFVGMWASVVLVVGLCLAADPKRPANQPAASTWPQPAPAGGGSRYVTSPNYRRAAQAAAAAAAARAAARVRQNANNQQPYGYGYSPYGYSPYASSYSPYGYLSPGTTPYVLGYNPLTGSMFLYPDGGGYSSFYPSYGYQYPYYGNSYLGYGYPGAVFASAAQLYGLGPIQQLMGVGQ